MTVKIVLVVEDDLELQDLYATMLRDVECTIVRAYDGAEAWRCVEKEQPALIILDILLDEVMGDEFLISLKADSRFCHIPVVIASVLAPDRCQHLVELDQATQHLQKPFRRDQLVAAVKGALGTED